MDLFNRDLLSRRVNRDRSLGSGKPELYIRHKKNGSVWSEDDRWRTPFFETIGRDPDVIRNAKFDVVEFECGRVVRGRDLLLARDQALESRSCLRHHITTEIKYRAANCSKLRIGD